MKLDGVYETRVSNQTQKSLDQNRLQPIFAYNRSRRSKRMRGLHRNNDDFNKNEEAIFRSADMLYIQLYLPAEISRELTYLIGELNCVMIKDMNSDISKFQRTYINQIKKLTDVENTLQFMLEIVNLHFDQTLKYLPPPELLFNDDDDDSGIDINSNSRFDSAEEEEEDESDTHNGGGGVNSNFYRNFLQNFRIPSNQDINTQIDDIEQFSKRLRNLNDSYNSLNSKKQLLVEKRLVVSEASQFLRYNPGLLMNSDVSLPNTSRNNSRRRGRHTNSRNNPSDFDLEIADDFEISDDDFDLDNDDSSNISSTTTNTTNANEFFDYSNLIIGSLERSKIETLRKILWRVSRGNLFFHNMPLDINGLNNDASSTVEKDCIIIFTHGQLLLGKCLRIVESLNGIVYNLPSSDSASSNSNNNNTLELNEQIDQVSKIFDATEQALLTELIVIQDQLIKWTRLVTREKMVYSKMNCFKLDSLDGTGGLLLEGWIPSKKLNRFSNKLKDFTHFNYPDMLPPVIAIIQTNKKPPTFFETNKFTEAFQQIVDAYGIASYKEINPGLATIVTFPFMFSIMFGDLGHGFIVLLCGAFLILNESKFNREKRAAKTQGKPSNEIFDMVFGGRYVILLMGVFSIYIGFLYNDVFSKSMTLFGKSGWEWPKDFKIGDTIEAQRAPNNRVYPFGIDFAWHGAENSLLFTNSYKMKLSILMGFIHMSYSYMFSYINYKHKNSKVDIWGNFVPGLMFMQSIFGYLSVCIVYKWTKDWIKAEEVAPSLLNMLINMFLSPGTIEAKLFPGQSIVQIFLLLIALVCVPWLLLYKPIVLNRKNKESVSRGFESLYHESYEEEKKKLSPNNELNLENEMVITELDTPSFEFNFGDIMIHQVIHTIEFCLNCISHTASYLRLWALSLAHAQLSSVLWDMTIKNAFSPNNPGSFFSVLKVVVLFAMWFVLTVCILVMMEGTSAMLHALRLHWVEAMSKFFEGEGYAYEPFTFEDL